MASKPNNSYFSRNESVCPACAHKFRHEDLLTGSGRLNAGPLTEDLHRLYLPKKEFGEVFPLLYSFHTCPACWLSLTPHDFSSLRGRLAQKLGATMERSQRTEEIRRLFGSVPDLEKPRDLIGGISTYVAAAYCYEALPGDFSPIFRQGLSCLRAAWLLAHLDHHQPGENFGYASKIFYRKAAYLYMRTVEVSNSGSQVLSHDLHGGYGPDTDNNFGVDGCIYLSALLQFKYGQSTLAPQRQKTLETARRHISLLVGAGKTSQRKTSALIENARDLYRRITDELQQVG